MPRWSTGCEECRRRKVRCDEARPQCERCTKHGMVCPGYRQRPKPGERFTISTPSSMGQQNEPSNHKAAGSISGMNIEALALVKQSPKHAAVSQMPLETLARQQSFDPYTAPVIQLPSWMAPQVADSHLRRIQMLSSLTYHHFRTAGERSMGMVSSQLSYCASVDHSMPLLRTAVDALCLAGVGSEEGDNALLHESHALYGGALHMLTAELQQPSAQIERRKATLSAILLLAMCDRVDNKGERGWAGWAAHLRGAQAYLKALGPEVIVTEFDWLLFHNIRLYSVFLGLAERKAVEFAERKWLALTEDLAKTYAWVAQQDLMTIAPGLLERADTLLHKQSIRAVGDLVMEIQNLRVSMQVWQNKLLSTEPQYEVVDISNYSTFASCTGVDSLKTVYRFRSDHVLPHNSLTWTCRLVLDCAILRLMHFRGTANVEQFLQPLTRKKVELDAIARATDLCRCVPYAFARDGSNMPQSARWYLDTAVSFFAEMKMLPETKWCKKAIGIVGREPYAVGSSTFFQASRKISLATRFRSVEHSETTASDQ